MSKKLSYYLSSYHGQDLIDAIAENFSADELIEMAGDDLMNFDGTFVDQQAADRVIDITITGGAADDVFYLNPDFSLAENANGHPISGKGVGGNTLTISCSPGSVEALYRYLKNTPMNCMGVRVTSSDANQLIKNFTITEYKNGPFNNGEDKTVNTSTFTNERDYKNNMITVQKQMFFDRNTRIAYGVLAGKTVTLTLAFGARLDIVKTAQDAVNKALAQKQQQPAVRVQMPTRLPQLPGTRQPVLPAGMTIQGSKTRGGAFGRR